jgi:type IV secretory pathway VirJ component
MSVLRTFRLLAASLLMAGAATPASTPASVALPAPTTGNAAHLSHGRFRDFPVYSPVGPPTSFVLLLSGDEGWNSTADTMTRQLVQQGAMVTGIDWAKFKANLEADGDQCVSPDGDLENLSHFV